MTSAYNTAAFKLLVKFKTTMINRHQSLIQQKLQGSQTAKIIGIRYFKHCIFFV